MNLTHKTLGRMEFLSYFISVNIISSKDIMYTIFEFPRISFVAQCIINGLENAGMFSPMNYQIRVNCIKFLPSFSQIQNLIQYLNGNRASRGLEV